MVGCEIYPHTLRIYFTFQPLESQGNRETVPIFRLDKDIKVETGMVGIWSNEKHIRSDQSK